MAILSRSVVDSLSLTQQLHGSIHEYHKFIQQTIALSQSVEFYAYPYQRLSHSLTGFIVNAITQESVPVGLLDIVSLNKVSNISVGHILSFDSHAAHVQVGIASSTLVLVDAALNVKYELLQDTIYFSDLVEYTKGVGVISALTLGQSVVVEWHRNFDILSELELTQDVIVQFPLPCITQVFVGGGEPTIIPQDHIELTFPFESPSETLVLKNPDFDDIDRLDFVRINRTSRNGDLIIHKETFWLESEVLSYRFSFTDEEKRYQILGFLNKTLGKEVGLKDYEGRMWRGILMSVQDDIEDSDRGGFDFNLEFQGELVA